jgi:hypothetical protein
MCYGCWEEEGKPQIDNEKVRLAAYSIFKVFEYISPSGGNLHIVIDDWNLEDGNLEFCHEEILKDYNTIELECCLRLKILSVEERYSALALHDGYWGR